MDIIVGKCKKIIYTEIIQCLIKREGELNEKSCNCR